METIEIKISDPNHKPPVMKVVVYWNATIHDCLSVDREERFRFVLPVYNKEVDDVPDWSNVKSSRVINPIYIPGASKETVETLWRQWNPDWDGDFEFSHMGNIE